MSPVLEAGNRVRGGHAEVVVGVDVDARVGRVDDRVHRLAEARRHPDAAGVRDIYPVGIGLGDRLDDVDEVLRVRPSGVHRREHTLDAGVFHALDGVDRALFRLLAGRVHRVLQLNVAGGDEHVDHLDAGVDRGVDVAVDDPREPANGGVRRGGDVAYGLELGVRVHREARLDDVCVHVVQRRRYAAFLLVAERSTW